MTNVLVSRIELIDGKGRVIVHKTDIPFAVTVSLQDEGRTMKIMTDEVLKATTVADKDTSEVDAPWDERGWQWR